MTHDRSRTRTNHGAQARRKGACRLDRVVARVQFCLPLLLVLFACESALGVPDERLRVLVWNVWRGGNEVDHGPEKIQRVIESTDPDLVLLQESYDIDGERPTLGRWVAERLGWHAHQAGSPHLCVLSPEPFTTTFLHDPWHGLGVRVEDERGRAFYAWSIWLDYRAFVTYALRDDPTISDEALLALETEGSSRFDEVEALLDAVEAVSSADPTVPTLVGGDFNCPSHLDWTVDTARVYRHRRSLDLPVSLEMSRHGFQDVYRAVLRDPVQHPGITWSPMFRQTDAGAPQGFDRIDRLYLRNPLVGDWILEPTGVEVLPDGWEDESVAVPLRGFPSDHAAVVLDLEWRRRDAGVVPIGRSVRFDEEVATLIEASRNRDLAREGTMLVGSSIFRLWGAAESQLEAFRTVNHGFGGARTWELLNYAPDLVHAFHPRNVVVYCGSNDVNAGEPASRILARLRRFTLETEAALPGVRVIHVSINRAPEKERLWPVVDEVNEGLRRLCGARPTRVFVDVNPGLLDETGRPRESFFEEDGLHVTAEGYREAFLPPIREAIGRVAAEPMQNR